MNNNSLISIIVPIYNVENELKRCVDSIINQTYKHIEIILVDDGSPDNCPTICDNYSLIDNRVVVIHKENGGLSDARNVGLKNANGMYILYVDSDDYIELDACEKLIGFAGDGIDVVVGVCKEIQSNAVSYQKHTNLEIGKKYTSKDYIIKSIKANEWYAPAWLNLYRRDFLIQNDLFYRKGYLFEDIDMLPRIFLRAKTIVYSDVLFYNYVIRDGSIIKSKITTKKRNMIIDIYNDWYELISEIEDNELLKWMRAVLVKYYLASARKNDITEWNIKGMTLRTAMTWSIGLKEKMKVFIFAVMPRFYNRISNKGKQN